jgi:hypothetical protein
MTQSGQPSVKGMGIFELIFWTAIGAIVLLIMYGVVVIVFRQAFGVELPNPVDWLPTEWRQMLPPYDSNRAMNSRQ